MTVKVQGILVTCVHLPNVGEQVRIKNLKRIWAEQEKKGLWKGRRHIFAGDFNSLTWEDADEEGWARVAKEMEASNMKLDEALSLCKKKQELVKDAKVQSPEEKLSSDMENNLCIKGSKATGVGRSLLDRKTELDKITAQLDSSLHALGIEDRGSKTVWYLMFKKLEEPKFKLTKLMKKKGFNDSWGDVEKMGEQIGSHITSK